MDDGIDIDKDYNDPPEVVYIRDQETGEVYYRHPITGQKIYVDDEE